MVKKSSDYFINSEKRIHVKKYMRKLSINNSLTTDPKVILAEQNRFYQDLHTSRKKCSNNNAIAIPYSRMNKEILAKARSIG